MNQDELNELGFLALILIFAFSLMHYSISHTIQTSSYPSDRIEYHD